MIQRYHEGHLILRPICTPHHAFNLRSDGRNVVLAGHKCDRILHTWNAFAWTLVFHFHLAGCSILQEIPGQHWDEIYCWWTKSGEPVARSFDHLGQHEGPSKRVDVVDRTCESMSWKSANPTTSLKTTHRTSWQPENVPFGKLEAPQKRYVISMLR